MGYAVMTTWKHKNPIDWKEMASVDFSMMPKGTKPFNGLLLMNTTMVLLQPLPAKKFTMAIKLNWMHTGKKYLLQWSLKRLSMQSDLSMQILAEQSFTYLNIKETMLLFFIKNQHNGKNCFSGDKTGKAPRNHRISEDCLTVKNQWVVLTGDDRVGSKKRKIWNDRHLYGHL